MALKPNKMLYTVATNGNIPFAGGIAGPLTTPTELSRDAVVWMLRHKYEVYQHNPRDLQEKVLVTMTNVGDISFKRTTAGILAKKAIDDKKVADKKAFIMDTKHTKNKENNNSYKKEETKTDSFINDFTAN